MGNLGGQNDAQFCWRSPSSSTPSQGPSSDFLSTSCVEMDEGSTIEIDEGAIVEMDEGRTVAVLLRRRRFACAAVGTELGHAQQLSLASTSSSFPDSPPPIRRSRVSGEGAGEGDGVHALGRGQVKYYPYGLLYVHSACRWAQTMARRRNWQHWGRVGIVMANFEIAEL